MDNEEENSPHTSIRRNPIKRSYRFKHKNYFKLIDSFQKKLDSNFINKNSKSDVISSNSNRNLGGNNTLFTQWPSNELYFNDNKNADYHNSSGFNFSSSKQEFANPSDMAKNSDYSVVISADNNNFEKSLELIDHFDDLDDEFCYDDICSQFENKFSINKINETLWGESSQDDPIKPDYNNTPDEKEPTFVSSTIQNDFINICEYSKIYDNNFESPKKINYMNNFINDTDGNGLRFNILDDVSSPYVLDNDVSSNGMDDVEYSNIISFNNMKNNIINVIDKPTTNDKAFSKFNLKSQIIINLNNIGIFKPTDIQSEAIPKILSQRYNFLINSPNATGKTLAYLLPIIELCSESNNLNQTEDCENPNESTDHEINSSENYFKNIYYREILKIDNKKMKSRNSKCKPFALILTPTRELACQINCLTLKITKGLGIKSSAVYGGGPTIKHPSENPSSNTKILIGTTGRIIDMLLNKELFSLEQTQYVVFDEADKLLDDSFVKDVETIYNIWKFQKYLPELNSGYCIMVSATFSFIIKNLIDNILITGYTILGEQKPSSQIDTTEQYYVGPNPEKIKQEFILTEYDKKQSHLLKILEKLNSNTKILIFVETKQKTDFLSTFLCQIKYNAISMNGDHNQQQREATLQSFNIGITPILVATSVVARGLNITDINLIINYDIPFTVEEYIHRLGRIKFQNNSVNISENSKCTLKKVISFVHPTRDTHMVPAVIKFLESNNQKPPMFLYDLLVNKAFSIHNESNTESSSSNKNLRSNNNFNGNKIGNGSHPYQTSLKKMEPFSSRGWDNYFNSDNLNSSDNFPDLDKNEHDWY